MARQLKHRGGTTAEHAAFTGVIREITVDTDKNVVVVHNGSTAGGFPMAKEAHTHTAAQVGSEPANANIQAHIAATGNPHSTTAAQVGAEAANANIQTHIASTSNPHSTTATQVGAVPTTDVVTTAAADKILKLNASSKLPASITGDAATVGGNLPAAFSLAAHTHSAATTSAAGMMSATDKTKLDGIASGAGTYVHPTTDGSLHVPATSTTNNTKVLKAGASSGTFAWGVVNYSEVSGTPTSLPASGGNAATVGGNSPSAFATAVHAHDTAYEAKNTNIQTHIASTANPHGVTKAQLGLGSVDNTADAAKSVLYAATAGNGIVVTGTAPVFGARVWAKGSNGTLTAGGNISSVTVSSNTVTVNHATNLPDVNGALAISCSNTYVYTGSSISVTPSVNKTVFSLLQAAVAQAVGTWHLTIVR